MVTGRVPFDADTPFAVVIKHMNDPLPLPRSIEFVNPGGPGARGAEGHGEIARRALSDRRRVRAGRPRSHRACPGRGGPPGTRPDCGAALAGAGYRAGRHDQSARPRRYHPGRAVPPGRPHHASSVSGAAQPPSKATARRPAPTMAPRRARRRTMPPAGRRRSIAPRRRAMGRRPAMAARPRRHPAIVAVAGAGFGGSWAVAPPACCCSA